MFQVHHSQHFLSNQECYYFFLFTGIWDFPVTTDFLHVTFLHKNEVQSTLSSCVYPAPQISCTSLKYGSCGMRCCHSCGCELPYRKIGGRRAVGTGAGCEESEGRMTTECLEATFSCVSQVCATFGVEATGVKIGYYMLLLFEALFFMKVLQTRWLPFEWPILQKRSLLWLGSTSIIQLGLRWDD